MAVSGGGPEKFSGCEKFPIRGDTERIPGRGHTSAGCEVPPTVIVVHPKERRSKCTVEPLRSLPGFAFWKWPQRGPEPLDDYVRLGMGGPELTQDDASFGLLVLDATWRYVEAMERDFEDVPVRSLPPNLRTAYPRTSKLFEDPHGGLATIEAIYAAYNVLGRQTGHLLSQYRWADRFVELNSDLLAETRS